jgi:hypothetical protein
LGQLDFFPFVRIISLERKKEVLTVATSSITKQFVVKDMEAFVKLTKEADQMPERKATVCEHSSLNRGRKVFKQFSLR